MDEEPAAAVRAKKDSSIVRGAEAVRDGRAVAVRRRRQHRRDHGRRAVALRSHQGRPPPARSRFRSRCSARIGRSCSSTAAPRSIPTRSGSSSGPSSPGCTPASGSASPSRRSPCCRTARSRARAMRCASRPRSLFADVKGLRRQRRGPRRRAPQRGRDRHRRVHRQCRRSKTLEGAVMGLAGLVFGVVDEPGAPWADAADAFKLRLLEAAAPLLPDNTGGAMLLGVEGVCIISHGSSSATAIVNAVRVARDCVQADVVTKLRDAAAATAEPDPPTGVRSVPAETHSHLGPVGDDDVERVVRDQLVEILGVDPDTVTLDTAPARRPRRRRLRGDRPRRGRDRRARRTDRRLLDRRRRPRRAAHGPRRGRVRAGRPRERRAAP